MILRSTILIIALFLANSVRADDCDQPSGDLQIASLTQTSLFRPYLEISAGSLPGVNESYSTLGVITCLPIYTFCNNSSLLSYTDVCWFHFLKGTNGASIEEGVIWSTNCCDFGCYLGYDWRRWDNHSFNQIAWGLLMTCNNWNLRFNMLYPIENEYVICSSSCVYEGGYKFRSKEYDATYQVISLSLGRSFCTKFCDITLSAAIEPYYTSTKSKNLCGCNEKSWGGGIYLLLDMCQMLHAEVFISQDRIFKTNAQVTIGIDLLEAFSSCSCACSFYPLFQRQKVVPVKHKESCQYNW